MKKSFPKNAIQFAVFAFMLLSRHGMQNVALAELATTNERTGPTLQLACGQNSSASNLLSDFMYFIPLISPEPVSVASSARTNQYARLLSFFRKDKATTFRVTCEFEFVGAGTEQNLIDQTAHIRRRERQLKEGKPMQRLLTSIDVKSQGRGVIEVEGVVSGGKNVVNKVCFSFNSHGQPSPVSIMLEDIHYVNGAMTPTNQIVAQVDSLTFERKPGKPTMEVTLDSIKPREARDTFWQNFKGSIKGGFANMFIPPLTVTSRGHDTLLEFGSALASQSPTFTFPLATNIVKKAAKVE